MISANTSVTELAYSTGRLLSSTPYVAHRAVPRVNTLCVMSEMPSVLFSRIIFIDCGSQQSVVQAAAVPPTISNHAAMSCTPVDNVMDPARHRKATAHLDTSAAAGGARPHPAQRFPIRQNRVGRIVLSPGGSWSFAMER